MSRKKLKDWEIAVSCVIPPVAGLLLTLVLIFSLIYVCCGGVYSIFFGFLWTKVSEKVRIKKSCIILIVWITLIVLALLIQLPIAWFIEADNGFSKVLGVGFSLAFFAAILDYIILYILYCREGRKCKPEPSKSDKNGSEPEKTLISSKRAIMHPSNTKNLGTLKTNITPLEREQKLIRSKDTIVHIPDAQNLGPPKTNIGPLVREQKLNNKKKKKKKSRNSGSLNTENMTKDRKQIH